MIKLQIANIDSARDFIAATIHDHSLIIVGGNKNDGKHTDDAQQYHPSTGR